MLHSSLQELRLQAAQCVELEMVQGVAAESLDLVRNAVSHNAPAAEVSSWLADVVSNLLHCPAITQLGGGAIRIISGSYGRGLGMPHAPIYWFTVTNNPQVDTGDAVVRDIFSSAGFHVGVGDEEFTACTRNEWEARIQQTVIERDSRRLGWFIDAGSWMTSAALRSLDDPELVFHEVLANRPPSLKAHNALPAADSVVDVRGYLMKPLADLARWAAVQGNIRATDTTSRLNDACSAGVLEEAERDYLLQSLDAGLSLVLARFAEGAPEVREDYEMVPQVERSVYGAACRQLSIVIDSVTSRYYPHLMPTGT